MTIRARHEIWIFRHGATEWSLTGQHTGRTDLPLSNIGRRQGQALGRAMANRRFATVLCSPLNRVVETCRLAGYGDGAQLVDDLMEWNYGVHEGLRPAEILENRPDWTIWNDGAPGGETVEHVAERARRAIALADAPQRDVAVFSHGHLLRSLVVSWLGLPADAGRHFDLATGSTSVLGYHNTERVIRTWNHTITFPPRTTIEKPI